MPSLDQLRRALDADPGDPFILYGLAMEHARLGDHETALAWFEKALDADPANPYHYFHKARSLEELGRADDARDALRAGLERARAANDRQATSEILNSLDMLC